MNLSELDFISCSLYGKRPTVIVLDDDDNIHSIETAEDDIVIDFA